MNIGDGINFWIGHDLLPFILMGSVVAVGYFFVFLATRGPKSTRDRAKRARKRTKLK